MISTEGKAYIARMLAEQGFARSIAFGLGNKPEALSDKALQFEFGRADINLVSYDYVNNRLIYKATLPSEVYGIIHEVGLYSIGTNDLAAGYGSRVLTSFDADTDTWTAGSFVAGGRIGNDSLRLSTAANATTVTRLDNIQYDFDLNSSVDEFSLAYNNANANTASLELRFLNDDLNYFRTVLTNPAVGYQITNVRKGNFVAVGVPDWQQINAIQVTAVAKSSGVSQVDLDGLRIEDTDTVNPDYVLISRRVLATPYVKVEGKVEEIEYAISVGIT